jgi:hypothetical protein
MDPTATPSIDPAKMSAPQPAEVKDDPLVKTWTDRVKQAEKHWERMHKRMRHNRKLVRGIDDAVDPTKPEYNAQRANLIQSTLTVVLSKVYAKNPEMSGQPTNKAADLKLFAETVSRVTQAMLESAKLKKKAKATVRAAMTCSFGVVKVQYQQEMREDPIIKDRIQDAQDNIARIDSLLAQIEDEQQRCDHESKKRELEELLAGLEKQKEVVAAEGLVIDRVPSDRLLVDTAVEDIWEYELADWMAEKIPTRKSAAAGRFPGFDLTSATKYKADEAGRDPDKKTIYSLNPADDQDDPIIMVIEVWSRRDGRIYTLVEGCTKQFARAPYCPPITGERWWPYFILPFQSVDGMFCAQSLVDVLERLQAEHNETRDKFAEVRRRIRPHHIASADLKDKDITVRLHPEIGEIVVVPTEGGKLTDVIQEAQQLKIDPAVYDTSPIRNDWEMVSGLQDAARSVVVQPKTATEASISDQSLAARISEFRDQIEDWLTEIAQYSSELCLLAMTPAQVEQIMGAPEPVDPDAVMTAVLSGQPPPQPEPTYVWPEQRTPDTVFNLIQINIRAGSTAAPNKLQQQETWSKALPLLREMVMIIRQIEAANGDATPERELVKETAARFDETIDVERFLPAKPVMPAMPMPGMGMPPGMPAPGAGIPPPQRPAPATAVMPGGSVAPMQ